MFKASRPDRANRVVRWDFMSERYLTILYEKAVPEVIVMKI